MTNRILAYVLLLILLLALLPANGFSAPTQAAAVSTFEVPSSSGLYQTEEGVWSTPGASTVTANVAGYASSAGSGPDDFGYTWDDTVPLQWIDATSGIDTGLSGESSGQATDFIALPFPFEYYENTYSQVIVAASGYLALSRADTWPSQGRIVFPLEPNNIIAPYWSPLTLASSGTTARVFYKLGGAAPNRYFVVQWNEVGNDLEGPLTFEVVLHESGDIVFQYGTITPSSSCHTCISAGIENPTGTDGLIYLDYCIDLAEGQKAVRFYRPLPSARVDAAPFSQGSFTHAGATTAFQIAVRNIGELGGDTYDITTESPADWPVSLYALDGNTPLSDTDSDGVVDTGSIGQGSTRDIVAKVTAPAVANIGDTSVVTVTFRSSLDFDESKTVLLQSTVPAPFAQAYRDSADGAMSLYMAQPDAQLLRRATPNSYYGDNVAVAEAPDGFVFLWDRPGFAGSVGIREVEIMLLDHYGTTVRGVTRLTDNSTATVNTYDQYPAVAVAPNGRIGVLWQRYLRNGSTGKYNYNIFFAILDSAGSPVYGPTNVTNNTNWPSLTEAGARFLEPRITATDDSHFVLAWRREVRDACQSYALDVYYAVRNTDGGTIRAGAPLAEGYCGPGLSLAQLSGSRAILAYQRLGVQYAVLDSSGAVVKTQTAAAWSISDMDAVQLSEGEILLSWIAPGWYFDGGFTEYALLDATTYDVMAGPVRVHNPIALTGDGYVSVTADRSGHGIITWMDYDVSLRRDLYYMLLDRSGALLTPPMSFRTSAVSNISTSTQGYGNTSYNLRTATTSNVDVTTVSSLVGAASGGVAIIPASIHNYGRTTATSLVVTATLDSALGYVNGWPTPTTATASTVAWPLDDLTFLGEGRVFLYTTVPSATIGTRYPVTWTATSAGTESNPADNSYVAVVMVARQTFLPLVLR